MTGPLRLIWAPKPAKGNEFCNFQRARESVLVERHENPSSKWLIRCPIRNRIDNIPDCLAASLPKDHRTWRFSSFLPLSPRGLRCRCGSFPDLVYRRE